MKWSQALAGSVLALSAQAGNATSLPPCPSSSHLVDTISAVGGKTKKIMTDRLAELDRQTTDQIVALTIDDKGTYGYGSMRELGIAYAEACKIGSSATDRGVLVTYEKSSGKYAIETSRGLEGIIPDIDTHNKIFALARSQCEKKSPGCILDKSTIQIEKILRNNPIVQNPRAISTAQVRNHVPTATARVSQVAEENSIDEEGAMVIGGIMLTSFVGGLGWMGYNNRRRRSSFRGGIRGHFQPRRENFEQENKGLREEIERIKLELISEGFLLGDIPGQIVWSEYGARNIAIGVLNDLRQVREHYESLSTFAHDARIRLEARIQEYDIEKASHDTIYGNTRSSIDTAGLRDSFNRTIGAFSGAYLKKDIPQIRFLEKQAEFAIHQIKRAQEELFHANNAYNQIPQKISSRRRTLSEIRLNNEYEGNEIAYRKKTGDDRFRSYNLSVKISALSGILDRITEIHRTKKGLTEVSSLIRRYDESLEIVREYIDLGPKLRRIKEDERQERLRAERAEAEERDLLQRRTSAATIYTSTPRGGDAEESTGVPNRGGAGYAGGGSGITIEPERNESGGDAGMGNDDKEDS